ncbi:T9SS type A sorting domain-containing protein [Apibacter muscae]|uniref:leucine-rich repeat protein n=1 Tax=Apibacter muscae TaxID=2509004 RepID=UPI0011ACA1D0|nr:leucine-rich repeat protein [Apibacter muscae]TWP30116.1 T9SS type A sorting domain-containing protein [Apibacter muscae]
MKRKNYHFLFFLFFLSWSLCWGQTSREYEVTAPGGLESLVSSEKHTITDLTLTGTLNAADFATIRSMAALQNLNLEKANLVDNTLPGGAFSGAKLLKIILPKTLDVIASYAFTNGKIVSIDFSKSTNLTTIGGEAFSQLQLESNTLDFSNNTKLQVFGLSYYNQNGAFTGNSNHVILPKTLKLIPSRLFSNFKGSISLPEDLETIDAYAFLSAKMPSIDFSHSPNLSTIGGEAFTGIQLENNVLDFTTNSKLSNFGLSYYNNNGAFTGNTSHVILPKALKIIPSKLFSNFKGSVTLPEDLEIIDAYAFLSAKMPSIDFSHSPNLSTIGGEAFTGIQLENNVLDFTTNSKLSNFGLSYYNNNGAFTGNTSHVILPKALKIIPSKLFSDFKGSITLSEELEIIEAYAFQRAVMPSIDFSHSPNLSTIGGEAFSQLQLESNTLDFSNNTKLQAFGLSYYNQNGAFTGNSNHVILPKTLKLIPSRLFSYFKGSVTLPEELEEIQNYVFAYSTIKELSLSKSLKTIGVGAFSDMKQLEKLSICATTPPTLGSNVFSGVPVNNVELAVPKNTISSYKKANQWSQFTQIIESNICEAAPINPYDLNVYAPNSYIFDIEQAKSYNYGGIAIPVAKAYAMWENNEYLDYKGIPSGKLSSSVYWEDVEGLIRSTEIDQNGSNSQINVQINQAKGKGNAVIAFHVGDTGDPKQDPVYWSWHVWVTDDPTKGITYDNGTLVNSFMDRNLGALSNNFLGNDWNRAGGLMYQWGRKDPFPPGVYLDGNAPIIHTLKYGSVINTPIFHNRNYNEANSNIQESVQLPYSIITMTPEEIQDRNNHSKYAWFTNDLVGYEQKNGRTFDLWGSNTEGYATAGIISEQKQKSSFDPCPAGWRVPSAGSDSHFYWGSPWGKYLGSNQNSKYDFKNDSNAEKDFSGLKIYPGLGYDFTEVKGYNIGIIPASGHYYVTNRLLYQDQGSEAQLWTATLGTQSRHGGTANMLHLVSDFLQDNFTGRYTLDFNEITAGHNSSLFAVRCVKEALPAFDWQTIYLPNTVKEYSEGLYNPNSYLLVKSELEQKINIPVNKAFAAYNQLLTDHEWPTGKLSENIYWTTNTQLIKSIALQGSNENGILQVTINPNQSGNAVISLHNGDQGNSNDPVLWSWHIWVSNSDPTLNTFTHTTENKFSKEKLPLFAYNTLNGTVPLTTTFMDRNLGATESDISSTDRNIYENTKGLLYQWGRKDPMPVFIPFYYGIWGIHDKIYLGSTNLGNQQFPKILDHIEQYEKQYTMTSWENTLEEVLLKSVRNPLHHLYRGNSPSWLPEVYPKLWGHANEKSPFDPCPDGWRVPDFSASDHLGSPWYKEGMGYWYKDNNDLSIFKLSDSNRALDKIGGVTVKNNLGTVGISLNSQQYNVGNYPAVGTRGTIDNNNPIGLEGLLYYGVNWSANMFMGSQTWLRLLASAFSMGEVSVDPSSLFRPRSGASVRCAKDETRFTAESIANSPEYIVPINRNLRSEAVEINSNSKLTESQVQVTPNPNSGIFKVMLTDIPEGMLRVFSFTGDEVYTKSFKAESEISINIQSFPAGVYVVQVQSQGQTVSKKIMKK